MTFKSLTILWPSFSALFSLTVFEHTGLPSLVQISKLFPLRGRSWAGCPSCDSPAHKWLHPVLQTSAPQTDFPMQLKMSAKILPPCSLTQHPFCLLINTDHSLWLFFSPTGLGVAAKECASAVTKRSLTSVSRITEPMSLLPTNIWGRYRQLLLYSENVTVSWNARVFSNSKQTQNTSEISTYQWDTRTSFQGLCYGHIKL